MKAPQRLKPADRRAQILAEGLRQAVRGHYTQITRDSLADALGISGPAILYHFQSMAEFKRALIVKAIDVRELTVLGQALIANDPAAHGVADRLRDAAMSKLVRTWLKTS